MIPKDKGRGMSNLGLWEKKPMFYYLVVFYLYYLSPFLSYPTSFNLFNVLLGSWAVMVAGGWAVIAFGSGVAGLSVLCPHPHSTHVCPFSPSRTLPWSALTLTTILVGLLLTQRLLAVLGVSRRCSSSLRVAEHPRIANSRPLYLLGILTQRILFPFLVSRTDWLGRSFHVRVVLTVLFGAAVSPRFAGRGFNPRIGLLLISSTFCGLGCSNSFWVIVDSPCVGWVSLFWDCA